MSARRFWQQRTRYFVARRFKPCKLNAHLDFLLMQRRFKPNRYRRFMRCRDRLWPCSERDRLDFIRLVIGSRPVRRGDA